MAVGETEDEAVSPREWSLRIHSGMLERLARRAAVRTPAERIAVEAPFSGAKLGEVPAGTPDDVVAATQAARAAQAAWAGLSVAERAKVFLRFHDRLLANADEILDLLQLETGKARRHAVEELLDVVIQARYYAHAAGKHLKPRRHQAALPLLATATELRHPFGVVGIIATWNYPLAVSVSDAIPAMMAGNAVVLKPDAQTPFSVLWAHALLCEAGLPADLFQVVTGRGAQLGTPLIEQTDYLVFTGSTATGRLLAAQAGSHLKGCSMELGGKNPLLVLPDAPLEKAVRGAVRGICSNSGQLCIGIERVYVHEAVYDSFVLLLAEALRKVRLGPALDFSVDMGSLISADQLATVRGHVEDARAQGAEVLAGGRARPDLGPYFYEPTLLAGVTPAMAVFDRETFGPVATVHRCRSVDEMVGRANDSDYGLNASIWTKDLRAGRGIAARLQCGSVNVNEAYASTWASMAPMGGFKQSGLGRRHGGAGLLKYTEAQTLGVQRLLAIDTPPGVTHAVYAAVMRRALGLLKHVPGID